MEGKELKLSSHHGTTFRLANTIHTRKKWSEWEFGYYQPIDEQFEDKQSVIEETDDDGMVDSFWNRWKKLIGVIPASKGETCDCGPVFPSAFLFLYSFPMIPKKRLKPQKVVVILFTSFSRNTSKTQKNLLSFCLSLSQGISEDEFWIEHMIKGTE